MPHVVSENRSVKGLNAFFIQPALTAGVILGQLLKVRPTGHLNRDTGGDRRRQRTRFLSVDTRKHSSDLKNALNITDRDGF